MLKENSIRRGSECIHSSEYWLHNSMSSTSDEALLPVTTENIRTRNFLIAAIPHPSDAKQFRYTTRRHHPDYIRCNYGYAGL
jgi:hypothetical protein